jgi:hypothetical protein
LIINDWTSVLAYIQRDLTGYYPVFGENAWIESVMGPSVTKEGVIITQPAGHDSC